MFVGVQATEKEQQQKSELLPIVVIEIGNDTFVIKDNFYVESARGIFRF